jgi:hypothetical protein
MQRTRKRHFAPTVNALETRESLSGLHHRPVHHAPRHAHVRPHAERAPHEPTQAHHTGTLIKGVITLDAPTSTLNSVTTTQAGTGSLAIAGTRYTVDVALVTQGQAGTLTIATANGSTITASVVTLPDGSVGNYAITDATGDFAGVAGTGVYTVSNGVLTINAHE